MARVVSSRILTRTRSSSKVLLDALRRLAPEDRLLDHDCHRFMRSKKPKSRQKPQTVKRGKGGVVSFMPERVREYKLADSVVWRKCQLTPRGYYVAGFREKEIVLIRGAWAAEHCGNDLFVWPAYCNSDHSILMAVSNSGHIHLALGDAPGLEQIEMTPTDSFRTLSVAGTRGWLPSHPIGLSLTPSGQLWCVELNLKTLKVINADGTPLATRELPELDGIDYARQFPPPEIPVYARDDGCLIGVGPHLLGVTKDGVNRIGTSQTSIQSIVGAIPFSSRCVVTLRSGGGLMVWQVCKKERYQPFSHDHQSPVATFMRDGRLVVLGDAGISLYSTEDEELKLLAQSPYSIPDVLGACQMPVTRHVAVCRKAGVIDVLSLPDVRGE